MLPNIQGNMKKKNIKLFGRLKFPISYSQNILNRYIHVIESKHIQKQETKCIFDCSTIISFIITIKDNQRR